MHRPEEFLAQRRVALTVGVGKVVPAGRRGTPNGGQGARVQAQGIADIIEAEAVCDLTVTQSYYMAPRAVCPGLLIHSGLAGQVGHQVSGNEVEYLGGDGQPRRGWKVVVFAFHPCRMAGSDPAFQPFLLFPVGW